MALPKTVLVTGGTGTFGRAFLQYALEAGVERCVILSRDELKQSQLAAEFPDPRLRWFIGDVRDLARLKLAFHDVDAVIHAAAMKQVPACEYNPIEAIQTNVLGAWNVIQAAMACGVSRVIALSSDKAVNPVNLYGATKLCAEKLFVRANAYASGTKTRFACVRYGNVLGSRGSVVEAFQEQAKSGAIHLTDERMTRFWMTIEHAVRFVVGSLDRMGGGEIFVPKICARPVLDLATMICPGAAVEITGIRPGEKLHEALLSPDEQTVRDLGDCFVIEPSDPKWAYVPHEGTPVPAGFIYTSAVGAYWQNWREIHAALSRTRTVSGGAAVRAGGGVVHGGAVRGDDGELHDGAALGGEVPRAAGAGDLHSEAHVCGSAPEHPACGGPGAVSG